MTLKREFEKILLKTPLFQDAKKEMQGLKMRADELEKQRNEEIKKVKEKQYLILSNMVKKYDMLWLDGELMHNIKFKCRNIIAGGKKECDNKLDLIQLGFFLGVPYLSGVTETDLLNSNNSVTIRRKVGCSNCGKHYVITNRPTK